MASVVYNSFKQSIADGSINLASDDIRICLCMTNTTCDTENDGIETLSQFTAIDKHDGANSDNSKALANEAVNLDDTNDRAEFDADDTTWTALGNGTRAIQGALIHKYVDGTDAADIAIAFIDFSVDQNPGGSDFTITWNSEGILQLT